MSVTVIIMLTVFMVIFWVFIINNFSIFVIILFCQIIYLIFASKSQEDLNLFVSG